MNPQVAALKQRIQQTAKRLAQIERIKRALRLLQERRLKQLQHINDNQLNIFGIDYAWGSPNPKLFKQGGVKYVMRYISHDAKKDLTPIEVRALRANGIKFGLVFESTANRALGGFDAGVEDAKFAKARIKTLGVTKIPVYFGVDFDATPKQRKIVTEYLNGAVSVLGKEQVGVYGSFYVVQDAVNFRTCDWYWQTLAWSGGQIHPNTHIYQYSNGHTLGGVSCDFDKASILGMESMR